MAKSKLLTAAVLTSALFLVACGGNTKDDDAAATTTTTASTTEDTLTIETTEPAIDLVVEQAQPDAVVEDGMDMMSDLLNMTLVFFEFDKSDIQAEYRDVLDAHAAYLTTNPNAMVVLEGHADERGTREYNLGLGERRSKQVAAYLQVKGVSAAQIDVVSYGEEKPLAIGKSESEYSQNRRVEIVYK